MSLTVVGSVAFDAIETPHGKTGKILGGAGTFISLSASYFNVKPQLISVVGGDFPDNYISILKNHNILLDGFEIKKDKKTFFWQGKYHNDMNNRDTLVTELNVLGEFNPIVPNSYQETSVLMLGNLSPDVQRKVIEQMRSRPKLIVMDTMNFWMNIALEELLATIKLVDVLVINDEEAKQLSEEKSLLSSAKKILQMGPKYLIIKKGEHGALLFNNEKIFFAPAMLLESVFDPTGAGDTFAGGFCGYLAKTQDFSFENLKKAIIYGSVMASFSVEKFGTDNLIDLSEERIKIRFEEFVDLTKI